MELTTCQNKGIPAESTCTLFKNWGAILSETLRVYTFFTFYMLAKEAFVVNISVVGSAALAAVEDRHGGVRFLVTNRFRGVC